MVLILYEVPEQAKETYGESNYMGWSGNVTGKGQAESDRNVPCFDPFLPHTTCKNKFQMN